MITAQDIRSKTFEKAVFGGYDMATVDAFLEEIANDLTLLQKENGVLKGKMKVLVDKVEEYRGNEDALRMAVLSAQKLGGNIEKEAKDKALAILEEARQEAARITEGAASERKAEEVRLQETKNASAEFIDSMDKLCRRQLEFLQRVSAMEFVREYRAAHAEPETAQEAAPRQAPANLATQQDAEIHETVKSIEETVSKAINEPVVNIRPDVQPAMVDDERPTRSFNIVSDPDDAVDRTNQFSLEDFGK